MVMFGRLRNTSKLNLVKYSLVILAIGTLVFFLYSWRLGTLTTGLSPAEVNARSSSSSLHIIANDPLYAPHKILQYGIQKIFGHSALALRSASVVFAIIFLFCFYRLTKGWFGRLVSIAATVFLATTPWFVLAARSAGSEILLLAPVVVLTSYYWFIRIKSRLAWLALILSSVLVIYLPGGFYLITLGLVFTRVKLKQAAQGLKSQEKIIGMILFLIFLAPIAYAALRSYNSLKSLLLIPADWPSILIATKSAGWDILAILWRTPQHTDFNIGRLPMFIGAQAVLALFGAFAFLKLARNKLYLLLGMTLFGLMSAVINQNLALLTFTLLAIALCIAAGLRYLYVEWLRVFPKNPLPKYLALVLIGLLVATQVFYGLRYSLVAWPHSDAARSTYVLK